MCVFACGSQRSKSTVSPSPSTFFSNDSARMAGHEHLGYTCLCCAWLYWGTKVRPSCLYHRRLPHPTICLEKNKRELLCFTYLFQPHVGGSWLQHKMMESLLGQVLEQPGTRKPWRKHFFLHGGSRRATPTHSTGQWHLSAGGLPLSEKERRAQVNSDLSDIDTMRQIALERTLEQILEGNNTHFIP